MKKLTINISEDVTGYSISATSDNGEEVEKLIAHERTPSETADCAEALIQQLFNPEW